MPSLFRVKSRKSNRERQKDYPHQTQEKSMGSIERKRSATEETANWKLEPTDQPSGRTTKAKLKSRITLRDTWSNRQAGAMRPVRRAGSVWAASCVPAAKKQRELSVRAQARLIGISLSFSVVGVSAFLPPPRSAMRRGAWECDTGSRKEGRSVSRPHCSSQ